MTKSPTDRDLAYTSVLEQSDSRDPTRIPIEAVRRLLKPRSVAIVGASSEVAAIGGAPLILLERFGYDGEVHLVSRTRTEINGRPCVPSIDELPSGVDAVILAIPQAGVRDAVEAAGRRGIGGVIVFSSGYAEAGEAGSSAQETLTALAHKHGLALAGPNCLGLVNFVNRVPLTFGDVEPNRRDPRGGLAIISQSGAMSLALTYAAMAQDIPVSYAISTGNEAVLGIEDYLNVLIEEGTTKVVALLIEQIRRPKMFLALAKKARECGIAICALHTGRGVRSQIASLSHTGAIAGDQDVLRAVVGREGVLFIDSLDELVDTVGLLAKTSLPSRSGVGFMTDSGAAKTFAIDFSEEIGLDLPELSTTSLQRLTQELPAFATASNPVDITAMGLNDPSLYARVAQVLLDDEDVGTVIVSAMPGSPLQGAEQIESLLPTLGSATKPVIYTIMGGESVLPDVNRLKILDDGLPLFRSPERALRAARNAGSIARLNAEAAQRVAPRAVSRAEVGPRILNEQEAKELLSRFGLSVPRSIMASTESEAAVAAHEIGLPVVLKISSEEIFHKSDVGGVALVLDEQDVAPAAAQMLASVRAARPDATIGGILVEQALTDGIEFIVGSQRDPRWGPFTLVGLGGIWAETIRDNVVIAGGADRTEIREALGRLRCAPILKGGRGEAPLDVEALIDVIELLSGLMRSTPEITGIEVNPLLVRAQGEGVMALDAMIETELDSQGLVAIRNAGSR